jgi:hypothetical protein
MLDDSRKIWRVNRHPRFTVLEMGEYMAAADGPRETLLRNMKYERLAGSLTYRQLFQAVTSYLVSPTRDRRILANCRHDLEEAKKSTTEPQQLENIKYELRALDAFERSLNALEIGGITLTRAPQSNPLNIEGVRINVRPTAHIRVVRPRGVDLLGAIVIDLAKGIEPKTEDTKLRVKNAMVHSAILVHQHVAETFADDFEGKPALEYCSIFHTHRQDHVCAPSAYRRVLSNVEAVCRNIERGWDGVKPPSSFDPKRASYRN